MKKNLAIWLTCMIANGLEKQGKSIPSGMCETIENKFIEGKYEEVFNFLDNRLAGRSTLQDQIVRCKCGNTNVLEHEICMMCGQRVEYHNTNVREKVKI